MLSSVFLTLTVHLTSTNKRIYGFNTINKLYLFSFLLPEREVPSLDIVLFPQLTLHVSTPVGQNTVLCSTTS